MRQRKPISTGADWSFELIEEYDRAIGELARDFGLDTYPNQIEVISSEQMMDAYAASGMPLGYHHWSYGKQFLSIENAYRRGQMGLAYEIVINSNPCIAYLMEENTITMQALVIVTGTTPFSRATTCFVPGPMPALLSITFCLPRITLPNASAVMGSRPSRKFLTPVTP